MKTLIRRCLRRGSDPAQWREARSQSIAGPDDAALTFPRREPVALLVIGIEPQRLRTMARLALSEFRRLGGAEFVDAIDDAAHERDRQVDKIAQVMDARRHLVIVARYESPAAYRELAKPLTGAGYAVATILVVARQRESSDPSQFSVASALEDAYGDLVEHGEVAWLVPGKPKATRRANRLGRNAFARFVVVAPPPEWNVEVPSDPLVRQRWECLQILRRRAAQEQAV